MSYTQYINKRKYLMPVIETPSKFSVNPKRRFTIIHLVAAFIAGAIIVGGVVYFIDLSIINSLNHSLQKLNDAI